MIHHLLQRIPIFENSRLRANRAGKAMTEADRLLPRPYAHKRLLTVLRGIVTMTSLLGLAAPARATMLQPMPLERVAHEAGRIVHGTVVEVRSDRDESGLPATWITLVVAHTLKGPHSARITIKQYGVAEPLPDGTITRVAGLPRYRVGDEAVIFLRPESRRGFTSPVGFGQGVYRVSRATARKQVRSESSREAPRDLEAFLTQVARMAARAP